MKRFFLLGILALAASGCMSQQERAALLNGPYTFQVDNSTSLGEAIRAGGYDYTAYRITPANFPVTKTGPEKLSAVLVPFSPQASIETLLGQEAGSGLRPATLRELLAFGQAYPDIQRRMPVIALGSSVDLKVMVVSHDNNDDLVMIPRSTFEEELKTLYPFLADGLGRRTLNLDWLDNPYGYSMYYACFVRPQ